jgi:hypothetical protein
LTGKTSDLKKAEVDLQRNSIALITLTPANVFLMIKNTDAFKYQVMQDYLDGQKGYLALSQKCD